MNCQHGLFCSTLLTSGNSVNLIGNNAAILITTYCPIFNPTKITEINRDLLNYSPCNKKPSGRKCFSLLSMSWSHSMFRIRALFLNFLERAAGLISRLVSEPFRTLQCHTEHCRNKPHPDTKLSFFNYPFTLFRSEDK